MYAYIRSFILYISHLYTYTCIYLCPYIYVCFLLLIKLHHAYRDIPYIFAISLRVVNMLMHYAYASLQL